MWWWYRNILFFLFAIIAAPLDYHVHWFVELTKKHVSLGDAITTPLTSGTLFIYAVIVVVEAIMRVETYPLNVERAAIKALKVVGVLLLLPFGCYLTNIDGKLSGGWVFFEWIYAALGLSLSIIAHAYISRIEPAIKAA